MDLAGTIERYSYVGDLSVILICIVLYVLIQIAYVEKTHAFNIFWQMLVLMPVAAVCGIVYHLGMEMDGTMPYVAVCGVRTIYNLILFFVLYLYVVYLNETVNAYGRISYVIMYFGQSGLVVACIAEAVLLWQVIKYGQMNPGIAGWYEPLFLLFYVFFVVLLAAGMLDVKNRIYRQVAIGVETSLGIAIVMMILQVVARQDSFTTLTFLLPMLTLLYLVHSSPYDLESGSVGVSAFEYQVTYNLEKGKSFCLMSLYMPQMEEIGSKFPLEIRDTIRRLTTHYFKGSTLFQISGGRMLLFFEEKENREQKEAITSLLGEFDAEYKKYRMDYKLLVIMPTDAIQQHNDYIRLMQYVEHRMNINEIRYVTEQDVKAFSEHNYIISELKDIGLKMDPEDPRVLAFVQPVYNTRTGTFDTGEALMRMKLPEIGMVFPDRFIPIAEKYNLIQPLTMIILAKTCAAIRKLLDEGYKVRRISINFSVLDIQEVTFCDNVKDIIHRSGIPFEMVAIEVTESRSEADFLMMKAKIEEQQHTGIKFYLDDFGTGYSNFEQIMELPFDIIKFDRSLTVASGTKPRTETMVSYLAHLFDDMGYAVLYEGIEDEADEERCIRMCAKYLQGFKYSRPIPIEQLTDFFEKDN